MDVIRVLHIDDSSLDLELVREVLEFEDSGFKVTGVKTEAEFRRELTANSFDFILTDYYIAGFDGLKVLEIVRDSNLDIPVIMVTGTGSEEVAVQALKLHAEDYVLKTGHNIRRLPQIIRSVLEKTNLRRSVEQQQKELAASEERFRIVSEATNDAVWDWDLVTNALWWNNNFQRVFGYRAVDIEPGIESWTNRVHPDDKDRVIHGIHAVIDSGGKVWTDEYRFLRADGTFAHVFDRGKVVRDKSGRPVRMIGAMMDITRRKQAEEALINNQRNMLKAQTIAHFGNWVWDPHKECVSGSEELFRIFGLEYTMEPHPVSTFIDRIHPDDQVTVKRALEAIIANISKEFDYEFRIYLPDGEIRVAHAQGEAVFTEHHELTHIFGVTQDITERKQAESALRESEQRFRQLADNINEAFFLTNPESTEVLYVSTAYKRIFGVELDSLRADPLSWINGLNEEEQKKAVASMELAKSTGKFDTEYQFRHPDGSMRWVRTRGFPIQDDNGVIYRIAGIAEDITERKLAEQKILGQIEDLGLLDQITRAIGERQDIHSIFQIVLSRLENAMPLDFGCVGVYDQHDSIDLLASAGISCPGLVLQTQPRLDIHANGLNNCLQGKLLYEPDISQIQFPFPQSLTSNGLQSLVMTPLRVKDTAFGILFAARRNAHGFSSNECEFLRQLSEHIALAMQQSQLYDALQTAYEDLRQTQQSVMQQERLRALGQMASGMAHDINNALSPVALFTESILETELNLSAKARGYLEIIQRAVDDVAQTIERMRDFYRQRETQVTLLPVPVNRLVEEVLSLSRARFEMPQQFGIVIEARTELVPALPDILGIESEIREAMINLIFNAVDAMPKGGTITIRSKTISRPEAMVPSAVVIEVADTGIGMTDDVRQRCFEPFYTTKGERGTGLGLAMVYGMIKRHAGEMEIDSAPGTGTTMRMIFPIATVVPEEFAQSFTHAVPAGLRLLVVDDNPVLLKSMQHILETDGHVTVTASDGQNGIDSFLGAINDGQPFDAVITDLGMPYIDGRQVAAAVKQAAPTTPVILLTGWGQRLLAENDTPPNVDHVLSKPPKLQQLRYTLALCCKTALIKSRHNPDSKTYHHDKNSDSENPSDNARST